MQSDDFIFVEEILRKKYYVVDIIKLQVVLNRVQ